MSCLIDYVGIRGCGAVTPPSDFYLNSLPGISLKSIEGLADAETKTYLGVWANIQTRSSRRFFNEVSRELAKRYRIKTVTQNIDLGRNVDTTVTEAPDTEYRGLMFNLDKWYDNDEYVASQLQSHYVQTAYFYASGIQAGATLKVLDYDLNTVVETFTFDAVAGWNTIPVNTLYENRRIILAVDSTAFTTVSQTIPESIKCCYDCGSYVQGASLEIGADASTVELTTNSHGLSVIYGVRCKYDNLICNNLELFTMAWAYLLGSELMMERLSSDTINKWTVNKEQAEELKAYYDEMHQKELESAIGGIDLNDRDCCLECDPPLAIKESNFH